MGDITKSKVDVLVIGEGAEAETPLRPGDRIEVKEVRRPLDLESTILFLQSEPGPFLVDGSSLLPGLENWHSYSEELSSSLVALQKSIRERERFIAKAIEGALQELDEWHKTLGEAEDRRRLEKLERRMERLALLVQESTNGHELGSSEVDLRKELESDLDAYRQQAVERGLVFDVAFSPQVPLRVRIDLLRLRRILRSLVQSSLCQTEKGSVSVEFDFSPGRLEVTVADTGAPIPPEVQLAIFAADEVRYASLENEAPDQPNGNSYGLASARHLAKVMGGDISLVSSGPWEGSVFRVRVKAEPAERRTWE